MTNRTQSNLRTLKSRNKREGWYAGKYRIYCNLTDIYPKFIKNDFPFRHRRNHNFDESLKINILFR